MCILLLFASVLSSVLCVLDFDCDRITQQLPSLKATHNSGSIHVRKNFMAKLSALSISNMVQKLCCNMFFHFVISARFCYYKVGHFANIL